MVYNTNLANVDFEDFSLYQTSILVILWIWLESLYHRADANNIKTASINIP